MATPGCFSAKSATGGLIGLKLRVNISALPSSYMTMELRIVFKKPSRRLEMKILKARQLARQADDTTRGAWKRSLPNSRRSSVRWTSKADAYGSTRTLQALRSWPLRTSQTWSPATSFIAAITSPVAV